MLNRKGEADTRTAAVTDLNLASSDCHFMQHVRFCNLALLVFVLVRCRIYLAAAQHTNASIHKTKKADKEARVWRY